MARVTGLEPATSGVTGRHSNQLSYTRFVSPAAAFRRREVVPMYGAPRWKSSTPEPANDHFFQTGQKPGFWPGTTVDKTKAAQRAAICTNLRRKIQPEEIIFTYLYKFKPSS